MTWEDIRPRHFICLNFLDHVQEFDGDDEDAPDGLAEGDGPLAVEVRGKVVRVDGVAVTVDGRWTTDHEVCYGRFTILRATVQALGPLRA